MAVTADQNLIGTIAGRTGSHSVAAEERPLIPAAEYVRMSDDAQQYSIELQQAAIREYAAKNGFSIIKTYADPGKSGVVVQRRTALLQLLADVVSERAEFKAILVYDVSRWGRYQNSDEAAHYEFICSSAGIPLHYCAEQFDNEGTVSGPLMKALKRCMAAEFSRELGIKVFRGKSRIVQLGFWVGSPPGYGYRRLMVSADGARKLIMKPGEHKSVTTDRVILIPGPRKEVQGIRTMFRLASQGVRCTEIMRELNSKGFHYERHPWTHQTVFNAITNPKYAGCNVWYRTTQKLRGPEVAVPRDQWIVQPNAFTPLIDAQTFERAQANLPKAADRHWTDDEILKSTRRLLKAKGTLNFDLFANTSYAPRVITVQKHFGSLKRLYELVGFKSRDNRFVRAEQIKRSLQLRRRTLDSLKELFPDHLKIINLPFARKPMLRVDGSLPVSVLFPKLKRKGRVEFWEIQPSAAERSCHTLVCLMNATHDDVVSYHLFSRITFKNHRCYKNDPWLSTGEKIESLSDFYGIVTQFIPKAILAS